MGLERFAVHRTNVFNLLPVDGQPGRLHCVIQCSTCPRKEQVPGCDPNTPPQTAAKHARRLGWDVDNDGKKATCRQCQGKTTGTEIEVPRHAPRACAREGCETVFTPAAHGRISPWCSPRCRDVAAQERRLAESGATIGDAVPPHAAALITDALERAGVAVPPPSPAAANEQPPINPVPTVSTPEFTARHMRQVILHLEERFDPRAGRYDREWDDARIAAVTTTTVEYVAALREDAYGPIRDEIAEAAASLRATLETEKSDLVHLIEETFAAMQRRVDDLEAQLKQRETH